MVGDQLSKRQDRALHRAFESVVLAQFPNPERKDCPGTGTLRAIANKRISMRDPALAHVGQCSPCFEEVSDLRRAAHRHKMVLVWSPVAAAIFTVLVFVGYSAYRSSSSVTPSIQGGRVAVVIDLRNASSSRTLQTPGLSGPMIELPRGLLELTINLPVGSEAGIYDVQIRKTNQSVILASKGQATLDKGITGLRVDVNTSAIPVGEYEFAWKLAEFEWRSHPLRVR